MFYNSYQSAAAALEKISGVLEEEPSVPDPASPSTSGRPAVACSFDDVEFAYSSGRVMLPDFDLDIPAGQTIALVGSTGAGKVDAREAHLAVLRPDPGAVQLDGIDLRELHPKDLRRAIVMVTQEAYLFSEPWPTTSRSESRMPSREEIVAAAKAVGARRVHPVVCRTATTPT